MVHCTGALSVGVLLLTHGLKGTMALVPFVPECCSMPANANTQQSASHAGGWGIRTLALLHPALRLEYEVCYMAWDISG